MSVQSVVVVLAVVVAVGFGLSLVVRRLLPGLAGLDSTPWTASLSYVATAYGVILGFSIIFLFGEFADARGAIGDEATSIGTAFDEAQLFPDSQIDIQHALICYSRAVPAYDWPALEAGGSSPVVDDAYSNIFATLAGISESTDGTFQPATATNLVAQLGSISTAREVRIVAAEQQLPPLLWALLVFGGVLVVGFMFVITLRAHRFAQAALIGLSAMFTTVMFLIVVALSAPFSSASGRLSPELIEQTTASMQVDAPEAAARPCAFETEG